MTALIQDLRALAEDMGADFFGAADLTPAEDAIRAQGGDALAAYPRAVSIGIRLLDGIVDRLPDRDEKLVQMTYRRHIYDAVGGNLDRIALRVGGLLQAAGFRAFPVHASQTINEAKLHGAFSHKMAAHLAGLGWIGKSCLLVTPEAGPRVRWATVLTDAPLHTGDPMPERCGACRVCVDACPPGAFTGRAFRAEEPRALRFDVYKCRDFFGEMGAGSVCGMCVYVCPVGKKA